MASGRTKALIVGAGIGGTRDGPGLPQARKERRPVTAAIVTSNRSGGPEGVIDAVEALEPDGFDDIEAVLPHAERERIVHGYAKASGFAARPPTSQEKPGSERR